MIYNVLKIIYFLGACAPFPFLYHTSKNLVEPRWSPAFKNWLTFLCDVYNWCHLYFISISSDGLGLSLLVRTHALSLCDDMVSLKEWKWSSRLSPSIILILTHTRCSTPMRWSLLLLCNPCKLQNKMRTFFLHKLDLTKLIFFRPHFFVCWPWLVLAVNAPSVSFRVSNLVPTSLIMWSTIAAATTLSRPPPSHSSLKSIMSTTIQDPNFPYLRLTIPINNLWHQQIFSSHHPTKVYPHSVLCPSSSNLLLLFQSSLLTN